MSPHHALALALAGGAVLFGALALHVRRANVDPLPPREPDDPASDAAAEARWSAAWDRAMARERDA